MTLFEIIASILGLLSVWLLTKQNIWCWPIGIVMVVMYSYIFYDARLYADMFLQLFFVIMQAYGWYYWMPENRKNKILVVSKLSGSEKVIWLVLFLIFSLTIGWAMKKYSNADLPYLDSSTAVMSLIAQWFMTKKLIENWILWIIADFIYIGMYCYKELYPTAILYALFLGLAFIGYTQWTKAFEKSKLAV